MSTVNNDFYIGLYVSRFNNIVTSLEEAGKIGYRIIATTIESNLVPLDDGREMIENGSTENWEYPGCVTSDWRSSVILIMSSSIDCDSKNDRIRSLSVKKMENWITRACFLQDNGYVMVKLKSASNTNLALVVSSNAQGAILVEVPVFNRRLVQANYRADVPETYSEKEGGDEDTWCWWNNFRWATNFDPKLKVVLTLDESNIPDDDTIRRWLGEPIEAIHIPYTLFDIDQNYLPVLSEAWQRVLKLFLLANVNVLISGPDNGYWLQKYHDYIFDLHRMYQPKNPYRVCEDNPLSPLQPLHDHLSSETYNVFEKDPIKYKLYQEAIAACLQDRVPEDEISKKLVTIMVLGAGRGPLVRCSLNAAKSTKRRVRIYIIEKNPNAICILRNLMEELWSKEDIHLYSNDMRAFDPPEKADIVVSELLGSFGDNELSPECLQRAQKLLKADGISIPYKSVSFINPVMSSKLFNIVRKINNTTELQQEKMSSAGFIVYLKNVFNISEPQALFEFVHPDTNTEVDNSRYKILRFKATMDSVLTGFGGYFEAYLYKDIKISINPPTHTVGMMSWFPVYFRNESPIDIKKNDIIELHFWRRVSTYKVWYEWLLTSPCKTKTFNRLGCCYPIYLY